MSGKDEEKKEFMVKEYTTDGRLIRREVPLIIDIIDSSSLKLKVNDRSEFYKNKSYKIITKDIHLF